MKPIATGATLWPIPRLASSGGVAHFGNGFRPFFLAGAIYAATEILVWVLHIFGSLNLPTAFSAVERQAHEMPYGCAQ
jgi:uncharacterized protein involved in response to NO